MIIGKEEIGAHLLTKHNIRYLLRLMERVRNAIAEDKLKEFLIDYLDKNFGEREKYPEFVIEALNLLKF